MTTHGDPRWLILETSCGAGQVALASGAALRNCRRLDEARRHARDLAPAVRELLASQGWQPRDLTGVIVSRGPGSYTGLRVGIMSAKALAYATGCALLAVDTFAAIALQAPPEARQVEVLADAQQGRVYLQGFTRAAPGETCTAAGPLRIEIFASQYTDLRGEVWLSGPGLERHEKTLAPGWKTVPAEARMPRPESLLALGLRRFQEGGRDDLWSLEPLYLRPSSAEEQWQKLGRP